MADSAIEDMNYGCNYITQTDQEKLNLDIV